MNADILWSERQFRWLIEDARELVTRFQALTPRKLAKFIKSFPGLASQISVLQMSSRGEFVDVFFPSWGPGDAIFKTERR